MIRQIMFGHGDHPSIAPTLRDYQKAAIDDIAVCGSEACGVHLDACDNCRHTRIVPNTCGNRSCPHCQGPERAKWVENRERDLLPGIGYFHVIATIPRELHRLARLHPHIVYNALLQASGDAVIELCADPRHLGARVGLVQVLHTWNREIDYHPHVHMIVTGGGWNDETGEWIDPPQRGKKVKKPYLLPGKLLSAHIRHHFAEKILAAWDNDTIPPIPNDPILADRKRLNAFLAKHTKRHWCVHIEPPYGSATVLIRYLGRYINRIAITEKRITAYDPTANNGLGSVTYTWTPTKAPHTTKSTTITATNFIQLYIQHVLPRGFQRIRYRGLLATAHRTHAYARARTWLETHHPEPTPPPEPDPPPKTPQKDPPPPDHKRCESCGKGSYHRLGIRHTLSRPKRRRNLAAWRKRQRRQNPSSPEKGTANARP